MSTLGERVSASVRAADLIEQRRQRAVVGALVVVLETGMQLVKTDARTKSSLEA